MTFRKINLLNGYNIVTSEIDPGLYQLIFQAEENEFGIVAIKPPKSRPHEATLALSLRGEKTKQFVDLSCMRYDENARGSMEIVMQTRGTATPMPYFCIAFNDGNGAGRVRKLVVEPDAIPVWFTDQGIQVRRNNNYDNSATAEELVTVNLAEMKDKVDQIYAALIANGTITE